MIALRAFLTGVATGIALAALWLTPLGRATLTYVGQKAGVNASRWITQTPACETRLYDCTPKPSPAP